MSTAIQIFNHPEFGDVRVVNKNGEPLFVGKDVAIALGYSNPRKALADHVPDKYKKDDFAIRDSKGREQFPTFITKAGLYKLVMRSNLPAAERLANLLCELISLKLNTAEVESLLKDIFHARKAAAYTTKCDTYIYVLLMENQKVKIGISRDMATRPAQVSTASGLKTLDIWQTEVAFPRKEALEIERRLHEKFADRRTRGEFFDIGFDDACEAAKREVNYLGTTNIA